MKSLRWFVLAAGCLIAAANVCPSADPKEPLPKDETNALHDQVNVLYTLYQLEATTAQLEAMQKIAKTTAGKPRTAKGPKVSAALHKAMLDLRTALVANADDVSDKFDALEDLKEKEKVDFDDEVKLTDAARKATPDLLKKFTARQIASFVADYAEDFPDPLEKITEGFDDIRQADAKDWKAERNDVAEEVGWLVGGLDPAADEKIKDQVIALLDKVHALKDDEFKAKRAALTKEAQGIIGEISPLVIIRHWVERSLAEVLSNPQLPAALEARLSKGK